MNNLFISYDLHEPGQNYENVKKAIKAIGSWAKVHRSLYYVSTTLTTEQAFASISSACCSNDKLVVIGAMNTFLSDSLSERVLNHVKTHWDK